LKPAAIWVGAPEVCPCAGPTAKACSWTTVSISWWAPIHTLQLIRDVGQDPNALLSNLPLTLTFPDGSGLRCPNWPAPLDALAGMLGARHWHWADRLSLLRWTLHWRRRGFVCPPGQTVQALCVPLSPRVRTDLIEPLCVAALNTPAPSADAQVLLRVLRDTLTGPSGSSHLLLPRTDLGALFPAAAQTWLRQRDVALHLGQRITTVRPETAQWRVMDQTFAAVVLATDAAHAATLVQACAVDAPPALTGSMQVWAAQARALLFEPIATVYAVGAAQPLPQPMLALRSTPEAPAQFVFDRGQLGGPPGLLAFVVSACRADRQQVQQQVLRQAQDQLGLTLHPLQTLVEKRATFACTPGLLRPGTRIAPGLFACGDYVAGPYPATLEGAVRSADAVCEILCAELGAALPI